MLSAPASIPARTVRTFAATFADGTDADPATSRDRPACSASSSTGTRPAADTRFGSSKTGTSPWHAFTYEMPLYVRFMLT